MYMHVCVCVCISIHTYNIFCIYARNAYNILILFVFIYSIYILCKYKTYTITTY